MIEVSILQIEIPIHKKSFQVRVWFTLLAVDSVFGTVLSFYEVRDPVGWLVKQASYANFSDASDFSRK